MRPNRRLGHARHLVIGFVVIAGGLTIMLGVLAWRFIALEEDLDRQRVRQRLEAASDGVVNALAAEIAESERWLRGLLEAEGDALSRLARQARESLPHDSIALILRDSGLEAYPRSHLLYYPVVAGGSAGIDGAVTDAVFEEVDALEFRERDLDAAEARLRELTRADPSERTADASVRAAVLLRLGRVLRHQGDQRGALAVYDELAALGEAWIEDLPAALLGAYNRCEMFVALGRSDELQIAATDLLAKLRSGRWHLTEAMYRFYSDKVAPWAAAGDPGMANGPDADRLGELESLASAVEAIWRGQASGGSQSPSGRAGLSILWAAEQPFVILDQSDGAARAVLIAGRRLITQQWLAPWEATGARQGVELELIDVVSGRTVYGAAERDEGSIAHAGEGPLRVTRPASETGLPWSVRVTSSDQAAEIAGMARQRDLLLVGLALVTCILLTSVYFIGRAVSREFEVARVQSDFVAAVSHEFRSPLTSMRHMIELLGTGRVPDEDTRDRFYDVLEREANRLQRLIEQLLDFRRLDEGAVGFDMQALDATSFIAGVVADFRDNAAPHGHALEVSSNGSLPVIRADREALARALLNLLENAVRYSPDCATVWLDVATVDDYLEVSVRDRGIGIPEDEHARIFRKFVRGSGAQRLGARGTGLGLAMVDEIVRAHGGEVTLDSKPGEGSAFTIRLPLAESAS